MHIDWLGVLEPESRLVALSLITCQRVMCPGVSGCRRHSRERPWPPRLQLGLINRLRCESMAALQPGPLESSGGVVTMPSPAPPHPPPSEEHRNPPCESNSLIN